MQVLTGGIILLLLAFIAHLIGWRIHLPKRQIMGLLVIFALAPFPIVWFGWHFYADLSLWQWLQCALFYGACAFVYIIAYSAIEEQSPTLAIIDTVAKAGGCDATEISKQCSGSDLLSVRLALLVQSGMAITSNGNYSLTAKGRSWARLFTLAARLIGLRQGG